MPPPQPSLVQRPRLVEQLNTGLHRKLTLISAPAGFGKTTLVSEWVARCGRPTAWLSLDEDDNEPTRFLSYVVTALQTMPIAATTNTATIGEGVLAVLQSPQPPPLESTLTALLNDLTTINEKFLLVLDDYHVIDTKPIDDTLIFVIDHLPPQMHVVIATREDPQLPLARLRARGQLTELRERNLRFTAEEASGFLNQMMGLNLSTKDIAVLDKRTEGWIAGLQLAALSMQGLKMVSKDDATRFIRSFTGSHQFVLDYLMEEVLQQQPESVQTFLLQTSILKRMCGPLCDAVLDSSAETSTETLAYLKKANLFLIALDNERRWFRYHHLFADLLKQRLNQQRLNQQTKSRPPISNTHASDIPIPTLAELHIRASIWYEENGLDMEAFHHATAANDIERCARLIEGDGMPLIFRGEVPPVLKWLAAQPKIVLDARPSLWVIYASSLLGVGRLMDVEPKLHAAEAALATVELNAATKDTIGHIAAIRAVLAGAQDDADAIITQSNLALDNLYPDNLPVRTSTIWTLGYAYQLQGDRVAARQAYIEAVAISKEIRHFIILVAASIGLGNIQELDNQLRLAAQNYQTVLELVGDLPPPGAGEAFLGLARLYYQWNQLDEAQAYCEKGLALGRQLDSMDRAVACEVFLARLKLAQGDVAGATILLAKASRIAHQQGFAHQIDEAAAAQVQVLLHQGNVAESARVAKNIDRPMSHARVALAQGDTETALSSLASFAKEMTARSWVDEQLRVMILQAIAHHLHGSADEATALLGDALAMAEADGFIRVFVDEGLPMAQLLAQLRPHATIYGVTPTYIDKLLAVLDIESAPVKHTSSPPKPTVQPLIEPLSDRELDVLHLIAEGLSNQEICDRLFLALSTVKGHNRNIFGKLQVQRRTEAVARARELGLL